jgi:predicted HTH domain antitoxin
MLVEVPDDIVERAEANRIDLRVLLAVQLYADNHIDHADACRLADLSSAEMTRELLHRRITVQRYPPSAGRRREAG